MSTKNKNSIFKLWWLIPFVAFLIIGGFNGITSQSEQDNEFMTDTNMKQPLVIDEQIGESELEQVVAVQELIKLGNTEIVINSIDEKHSINGKYLTSEQFVVMNVSIRNNGNEAFTPTTSHFKLAADGGVYEAHASASLFANENGSSFFLESINPGEEKSGNIVFEVPVGSHNYTLEIQTDNNRN